jgi:Caspase domain
MTEEARRFLIAVGVETYEAPEWDNLDYVPKEIACIVDLLTGPQFQIQRVLEPESKCPDSIAFLTALSAWVKCTDRQAGDHVVLYWSGHGAVVGGRLRLVLPNTTDVRANALALEDIVEILVQDEARIGPILLLLDVCFAGHAALDIGARLKQTVWKLALMGFS